MGRMARGWKLTKLSWRIIMQQPAALALPLVAAAAEGAIAVGYIFGVTGTHVFQEHNAAHYVELYPLLVALTLVATFANAVIVAIADARLRQQPISVRQALSDTVGRLPLLLGWALVSASVGLVLRILEERLPLAGRIAAAIAGVAWSLATVLVVPVLVLEGVGPVTAVRRSGHLFRERWGEQLTGQAAIGLPIFICSLPFFVVGALVATQVLVLGIVIIALTLGIMVALSGALSGVFQTALYRYAVDGESPSGFYDGDLAEAFRPRKRRGYQGV
ncbi:MAG TPA: DUF6159 family protein [Frankiaceae bacterium]|nr:DUF6159 family protein [Frankiaceae bacterium]